VLYFPPISCGGEFAVKRSHIFLSIIAASIFLAFSFLPGCGGNEEIEIKLPQKTSSAGMVYMSGGVNMRGYYPVKDTDTLKSLIMAAGGVAPGADLKHLRLYIASESETAAPQKIDLNRAEAWLLAALPGIGEVTAGRIVEYRLRNGPFRNLEDLRRVEGIGQITLDKIKDLVTVSE
jgi:competence protein ComEA